MELIDKAAILAEIERRLNKLYNLLPDASKVENGIATIPEACNTGKYMALESFREFLNTLEVKEIYEHSDSDLDSILEKIGVEPNSKSAKMFKTAFYKSIDNYLAKKG